MCVRYLYACERDAGWVELIRCLFGAGSINFAATVLWKFLRNEEE